MYSDKVFHGDNIALQPTIKFHVMKLIFYFSISHGFLAGVLTKSVLLFNNGILTMYSDNVFWQCISTMYSDNVFFDNVFCDNYIALQPTIKVHVMRFILHFSISHGFLAGVEKNCDLCPSIFNYLSLIWVMQIWFESFELFQCQLSYF
jgi:hypothetical protein